MSCFPQPLHATDCCGAPVVVDYREDTGEDEGKEQKIEILHGGFISMKGNLGISKKLKKEVAENTFKCLVVLN